MERENIFEVGRVLYGAKHGMKFSFFVVNNKSVHDGAGTSVSGAYQTAHHLVLITALSRGNFAVIHTSQLP